MSLNLTKEQVEYLKGHRFYYVVSEDYPYVYGHIKGQRHEMEVYNEVSVSRLIIELETYGEPLNGEGSVYWDTIKDELYSIDSYEIDRISMKRDRKTGEMIISDPIKSFFNARYTRLIVNESTDYISFISRFRGDMGDGSQYIQHAYKTKEAIIKVAIPMINRRKKELEEQSSLLDRLMKEYVKGV